MVIDVNDPLASKMNDVSDIKTLMPNLLESTVFMFRNYKIPDGKPANRFAFDGEVKDAEYAKMLVDETHESWKKLISGAVPNKSTEADYDIAVENVSVEGSAAKLPRDDAKLAAIPKHDPKPPAPVEGDENNKWYYVDEANAKVINAV
jgi:inorganic pyrophosphatase